MTHNSNIHQTHFFAWMFSSTVLAAFLSHTRYHDTSRSTRIGAAAFRATFLDHGIGAAVPLGLYGPTNHLIMQWTYKMLQKARNAQTATYSYQHVPRFAPFLMALRDFSNAEDLHVEISLAICKGRITFILLGRNSFSWFPSLMFATNRISLT